MHPPKPSISAAATEKSLRQFSQSAGRPRSINTLSRPKTARQIKSEPHQGTTKPSSAKTTTSHQTTTDQIISHDQKKIAHPPNAKAPADSGNHAQQPHQGPHDPTTGTPKPSTDGDPKKPAPGAAAAPAAPASGRPNDMSDDSDVNNNRNNNNNNNNNNNGGIGAMGMTAAMMLPSLMPMMPMGGGGMGMGGGMN